MKRQRKMQRKYFLRKLRIYLLCITLPIFLIEASLVLYFRHQMQTELSVYAKQSRNYVLYNVTSILNIFSEQTQLFSSIPSLSFAISKLQNEETLDYKSSIYKSLIFSSLSTSSNLSEFVDTIYVYFNNPYGNYFSSTKEYANINFSDSMDKEWMEIYQDAPSDLMQWVTFRQVRYFSFEQEKPTVSVFRRLYPNKGVMVINLNTDRLAEMLSYSQIYDGAYTLIADNDGKVLFGSDHSELLDTVSLNIAELDNSDSLTSFDTVTVQKVDYIYFTSTISEYGLKMITLIPSISVLKTLNSMLFAFSIMFFLSILLSICLSGLITRSNFKQLQNLLALFHRADSGEILETQVRNTSKNEYDIIFNNIIQTFVSNSVLKLNLAHAEMKRKDAQLVALQLQINPHFIFNTLQTIDMEVLRSQPESKHASQLIHNLSDILKYSLENTLKTVRIKDEIAICKIYAEIQKFHYTNPFILYWDYDDEILDEQMIHLILQPLLENSLHHGIKELPGKGLVKIKIFRKNGLVHIHIIDNGIGMDKKRLEEVRQGLKEQNPNRTSHIGIYNTNLRLILTYGDDSALRINSKKGLGTSVSFSYRAPKSPLPILDDA